MSKLKIDNSFIKRKGNSTITNLTMSIAQISIKYREKNIYLFIVRSEAKLLALPRSRKKMV